MTALGKLFRTTAFKLSFAYLVIFTIFAFGTLGYVAWSAQRLLDDQFVSTIEAEITGLSEQYRLGGLRRLVDIVERRSRAPGASLYLVTTNAGERIAGNIGALPPGVHRPAGPVRDRLQPHGRDGGDARPWPSCGSISCPAAFASWSGATWRSAGACARSSSAPSAIRSCSSACSAALGGWFITRRVLKRVDDMTETTRTIMAGDLGGRLRVAGTGDELDRLAAEPQRHARPHRRADERHARGLRQHRPRPQDAR